MNMRCTLVIVCVLLNALINADDSILLEGSETLTEDEISEILGDDVMYTQPSGEQYAYLETSDSEQGVYAIDPLLQERDALRIATQELGLDSSSQDYGESFDEKILAIEDSLKDDSLDDLDPVELIKKWGQNFVYTLDQQLNFVAGYVHNWYRLAARADDANLAKLPMQQMTLALAQKKLLEFLAGGVEMYKNIPGLTDQQILDNSQPLASTPSYTSQLWLRGMLYPNVSANVQISSAFSEEKSAKNVTIANASDNLNCMLYYLNKALKSRNIEISEADIPDVLRNATCSLQTNEATNYPDNSQFEQWRYMDSAYRFSEAEIRLLISSVLNGFYIAPDDIESDSLLSAMLEFYIALEYYQPILRVCDDIYSQMIEKNTDNVCTNKIVGPCVQCTRLKIESAETAEIPGTFASLTEEMAIALNSKFNQLKAKVENSSLDITSSLESFPHDSKGANWPYMTESDSKADIRDFIETLQELSRYWKQFVFMQLHGRLIDTNNGYGLNKQQVSQAISMASIEALLDKDNLFGSLVESADSLDCTDIVSLDDTADIADLIVKSDEYNQAFSFLSYINGDTLWQPLASTPAVQVAFNGEVTDDDVQSLSYAQLWPEIATNITPSGTDFMPWYTSPESDDDDMYETNPQLLNRSEIDAFRTSNLSVYVEGGVGLLKDIIIDRSNAAIQLYREVLERSINMSQKEGTYCSLKMLGHKSAQWRFDDGWVESIWLSDMSTVMRHIGQLLAELNYRLYIITDHMESISLRDNFDHWATYRSPIIEKSVNEDLVDTDLAIEAFDTSGS